MLRRRMSSNIYFGSSGAGVSKLKRGSLRNPRCRRHTQCEKREMIDYFHEILFATRSFGAWLLDCISQDRMLPLHTSALLLFFI